MPLAPFIPAGRPRSASRRARLALGAATLGIGAALLAYAISPGVRHAVKHAAGRVREEVGDVFHHDHARAAGLPGTIVVGPRVSLGDLRGERALLVFWGAGCTGCHEEAGAVEALARETRTRGRASRVVGVGCGVDAGTARALAREYHFSFPNLRDATGGTCAKYGVRDATGGLPLNVVLDAQGRIAQTLRGARSEAALARALRG
jgi:peroxiredoxin